MSKTLEMVLNNIASQRLAWLRRITGETGRDLWDECNYPDSITPAEYRKSYDRGDVAERVVSIYPTETWVVEPEIFEQEEPELTEFEQAWEDLAKLHNVFHYLQRIDELSGIGHYGVLLLGFGTSLEEPVPGVEEAVKARLSQKTKPPKTSNVKRKAPKPEKEPVENAEPPGTTTTGAPTTTTIPPEGVLDVAPSVEGVSKQLLYLRPFDEEAAKIAEYEQDVTNPRYGLPKYYNITLFTPTEMASAQTLPDSKSTKVHWTHVIHVADNRKGSETFGTPRQRPVWNRLLDLQKVLGGSAEMYWRGALPGFSFEGDPENTIAIDRDELKGEIEKWAEGLQRYLTLEGVEAKSLAPQVVSPEPQIKAQLMAIAITIGAPYRIFLGSEAAHLASTQDQETWNNRIIRRQQRYVTPMIIREFVDRLIAAGVLPEPEQYDVHWPDLNAPAPKDKVDIAAKKTEALAKYVGGDVETLIPPKEYLTIILGLEEDEAEAIMEAAMEHQVELEAKQEEERAAMAELGMTPDGKPIPPPPPPNGPPNGPPQKGPPGQGGPTNGPPNPMR